MADCVYVIMSNLISRKICILTFLQIFNLLDFNTIFMVILRSFQHDFFFFLEKLKKWRPFRNPEFLSMTICFIRCIKEWNKYLLWSLSVKGNDKLYSTVVLFMVTYNFFDKVCYDSLNQENEDFQHNLFMKTHLYW